MCDVSRVYEVQVDTQTNMSPILLQFVTTSCVVVLLISQTHRTCPSLYKTAELNITASNINQYSSTAQVSTCSVKSILREAVLSVLLAKFRRWTNAK